jgi:ApeA N-terminal domain 1
VQSCESYHAIRFKRRGRQTADAHATAVEEVLATIPERHAGWVEQRLRPRSGISLADRLLSLVHKHEAIIGPVLEDAEDFCQRAAATRHYLTHGTRRSAAVLTDMKDILFGGWVLRILFEACLLTELDIIPSVSVNPFEGTSRYEHLKAHPLTLSSAVGRPQK